MKKKLLITALLPGCLLLGMAAPANLTGRWTGTLLSADSTAYPLTYNLELTGDSVTGTATSRLGQFAIERGKLDTAGLHFMVAVNGLDVLHNGKVYADSIGMDISVNGTAVHCTLNRDAN